VVRNVTRGMIPTCMESVFFFTATGMWPHHQLLGMRDSHRLLQQVVACGMEVFFPSCTPWWWSSKWSCCARFVVRLSMHHDKSMICRQSTLQLFSLDRLWIVTDYGVAHLSGLSALQDLHQCRCRSVTDCSAAHLSGLTAL
jgi:hypothetical protein